MKATIGLFVLLSLCGALLGDGTQPAGTGSAEDPYQVATLDNLLWVSTNPASWSSCFLQTNYIYGSEASSWNDGEGFSPIGSPSNPFCGTYDGQNFEFEHLVIHRSAADCQALFGCVRGATIRNVILVDAFVYGHDNVGSVVGYSEHSVLERCFASAHVGGNDHVGGIVGAAVETSIICCANDGCWLLSVSGNDAVGGLAGYFGGDTGEVSNCCNSGNVSGHDFVGGLIGTLAGGAVYNSYSAGGVTGSDHVGGLIGYALSPGGVLQSYWDTDVSGTDSSAGGEGRTTSEMTFRYSDNTYCGWDFTTLWKDDCHYHWNSGYPYICIVGSRPITPDVWLWSFYTIQTAGNRVCLFWRISSTYSVTGFNLYRSTSMELDQTTRVNTEIIEADSLCDNRIFLFEDEGVTLGTTYYYWIEIIVTTGDTPYFGPLFFTPTPDSQHVADVTGLLSAYPNPFNPSTSLMFSVQSDDTASLDIFNPRGQRVRSWTGFTEGRHTVVWDGTDDDGHRVGSGVYFYRLSGKHAQQTRKVLLLK